MASGGPRLVLVAGIALAAAGGALLGLAGPDAASPPGAATVAASTDAAPGTAAGTPFPADRSPSTLVFEADAGHLPEGTLFAVRGGPPALLTAEGIAIGDIFLRLADGPVPVMPGPALASVSHHFIGDDPARWSMGVPHHAFVTYQTGPGTRVVVLADEGRLRFDHIIEAEAAPSVGLTVEGGTVQVAPDGTLTITGADGHYVLGAPHAYQDLPSGRTTVAASYHVQGPRVTYDLGPHDPTHALTIDPTLRHSTFLGNAGTDNVYAVAVRPSAAPGVVREVFVAGSATNLAAPAGFTTVHSHPGSAPTGTPTMSGTVVLVGKYNYDVIAQALAPAWYAYIGHTNVDVANDIAIDAAGRPVVTGYTHSNDFPTVNSILDATENRGVYDGSVRNSYALTWSDAFVLRLSADGSALEFSSFLGGKQMNYGEGVAVDGDDIIVVGHTGQSLYNVPYPVKNGYQLAHGDVGTTANARDAFITRIDTATSPPTFVFSTHLGAAGDDHAYATQVDASGNAYVAGATMATAFPTTAGAFQTTGVGTTAFVAKFGPTGTLAFSTRFGGSGTDQARDLLLDGTNRPWFTGSTTSGNLPACAGCTPVQTTLGGSTDAFLASVDTTGASLVYRTYLGGAGMDGAHGLARDPSTGHITLVGFTDSANFPTGGVQPATYANRLSSGATDDAFVTRIDPAAATLAFSTYFGGTGAQTAWSVAADDRSTTYVVGQTAAGFNTLNPVQGTLGGSTDGFVAIFNKAPPKAIIEATAPTFPNVLAPPATSATYPTGTVVALTSAPSYAGDSPIGTRDWELFDGATLLSTATGTVPSFSPVSLATQGTRTICLTLTDTDTRTPLADFEDTACLDLVFANRPPVAAFTTTPNPVAAGSPVQFTDASTDPDGSVASRLWTFGDSTTSSQTDPSKAYGAPGSYTVTLTVTDNNGAQASATVTVVVTKAPASVFTVTGSPFTGTTLTFTDGSTPGSSAITSWQWDFGDGTVITATTGAPVTHSYLAAGTFTARLTVSDGTLSHTSTRSITIASPSPTATADAYTTPDGTPLTVAAPGVLANDASPTGAQLTVAAHTEPSSGTLSIAADGSFTYAPDGGFIGTDSFTYHVAAGGAETGPVTVSLVVRPFEGPTAAFAHSGLGDVQFVDTSRPGDHPIATWLWQFPDGQTSAPAPVWPLALGTHTVSLTVTDTHGLGDTLTRTILIQRPAPVHQVAAEAAPATDWQAPAAAPSPPDLPPVAVVTAPQRVATGASVTLDGSASSDPEGIVVPTWRQVAGPEAALSMIYTLTPTFVAAAPGAYTFELSVWDGSRTDEDQVTITVVSPPPAPSIAAQEDGMVVRLVDESGAGADTRRLWLFGDGSTAEGLFATHTYAQPGIYTVTLRLERNGLESEAVHTVRAEPLAGVPSGTPHVPGDAEPQAAPAATTGPGAHVYVLLGILSVAIVAAVAVGMVVSRR